MENFQRTSLSYALCIYKHKLRVFQEFLCNSLCIFFLSVALFFLLSFLIRILSSTLSPSYPCLLEEILIYTCFFLHVFLLFLLLPISFAFSLVFSAHFSLFTDFRISRIFSVAVAVLHNAHRTIPISPNQNARWLLDNWFFLFCWFIINCQHIKSDKCYGQRNQKYTAWMVLYYCTNNSCIFISHFFTVFL